MTSLLTQHATMPARDRSETESPFEHYVTNIHGRRRRHTLKLFSAIVLGPLGVQLLILITTIYLTNEVHIGVTALIVFCLSAVMDTILLQRMVP
ncbi:protein A11 [Aotine betaherpesvirus 1]|uniref:Protein A11 n=1 Tax=Aotine betaherpesvirus 1 TaxID=50290 RepID=G8XU84_9BETA|nr:protein A11 [Aotine betaherpesvirus 1]AEV80821.1 protein A11 [Aotine betaherpesvirus 1]